MPTASDEIVNVATPDALSVAVPSVVAPSLNVMTPPGSVLISAYTQRGLANEAKGDFVGARQDFGATLDARF